MGGTVATGQQQTNQNQNQNQTSTTVPWGPGAGAVSSILGNLSGINPGLSPSATGALATLTNMGGVGNPFMSGVNNATNSMLAGGGATDQAGNVNANYQKYAQSLAPFTNPAFLDPRNTPGFSDALGAMNSDITNQVNSTFAGAGRDLSGMNTLNLARGLSQGEGGLIQQQYNVNAGNQLGALGSRYNAGNTNAGILSGMQQQAVANEQAGIGNAGTAFNMSTAGPLLQLQAESMRTGIPLQTLAQQMGIALPATQAFGTTTGAGTGTQQGTTQNQSPLWQQLAGGAIGATGLLSNTGAFGQGGTVTNPQGGSMTTNPGWLTNWLGQKFS